MSRLQELWGTPRRATASALVLAITVLAAFAMVPLLRELGSWMWPLVGLVAGLIWKFPTEAKTVWAQLLSHVAWASRALEREQVRNDLEAVISTGTKEMNADCPGVAPSRVRLRFVRTENEVATLPDGTLLIGVTDYRNRARNLLAAAWTFAHEGVLRVARPYLDQDVSDGIDFIVVRRLLGGREKEAVEQLVTEMWNPAVQGRPRLRRLTSQLADISRHALLGPVVFNEFLEMGARLFGTYADEEAERESADFIDFVHAITRRETGQELPEEQIGFRKQLIRCRFMYIARQDVYALHGKSPYLGRIDLVLRQGYKRLYLLARGPTNVRVLAELGAVLARDGRIADIAPWDSTYEYTSGRPVPQLILRVVVDDKYEPAASLRAEKRAGPMRPKAASA